MRKPFVLLLVTSLCLLVALIPPLKKALHFGLENEREEQAKEAEENEEKEMSGALSSWFWARAYPDPYFLNEKYMNGWRQAVQLREQTQSTMRGQTASGGWNSLGPNNGIGGRMLSIAIDPTNSQKLFAGSAGGGIWKSTNGGSSWISVPTGAPVVGVTSIIIDPSNVNNIYAATGEVYRVDSTTGTPNPGNTGFNVWKTRGTYSVGLLKSTDGGVTWTRLWSKATSQLFGIQSIRFDPATSSTIYACTTDGLYRSTDAGVNWTNILKEAYVSDVVINGANILAAVGNLGNSVKSVWKSTDGGTSFAPLASSTGLPATFQGFIKFSWVSTDPNTVVASVGVSETTSVELYRTTNFGTNWTGLSNSNHCDWQYWCAHSVAINPSNTNQMIYGGVYLYQYTLSPSVSHGTIGGNVHSDVHDIKFDPTSSGNTIYVCCDGGIYKSTDGGANWAASNSGLNATQFYASVGVSSIAADPNLFVGGLQDNGQVVYDNGSWNTVGGVGGDGTACAIDPSSNSNMVVSRDARGIFKSTNRGVSGTAIASYWGKTYDSRTAFAAPVAYAKSSPSIVYAATDGFHKSTSLGTFTNSASPGAVYIDALHKTAIALAVSATNANKVYVSVSNFAQYDGDVDNLYLTGTPNVLRTLTGGTPFTSRMGTGANLLPNRFVMDFAISPTNDDSVFVAVGGFGTSHIYVTGDGGANWTATGAALPDVPFNAVLIDPVNPKIIYAGSDLGVYVSPNRGGTWYDFNNGFGTDFVQVMDLQATADNQIVAATHGKGLFRGARYSGTLPVTFSSFTGEAQAASNKLQWRVGQEVNVQRYELERSTDGNNFARMASVAATGATAYTYSDILQNNQSYYYRLKSVDRDGSMAYSGIVYIRRAMRSDIQVLGNPFRSAVAIQFALSQSAPAEINLYDAGGKLLRKEKAVIPSGQYVYSVNNLSAFPAGTYFVEAILNGRQWKQKVMKK